MITTFGRAPLRERHRARAVGRLADHADVRGAREREPQAFADDLVVVDDQARDLGGAVGGSRRADDQLAAARRSAKAARAPAAVRGGPSAGRGCRAPARASRPRRAAGFAPRPPEGTPAAGRRVARTAEAAPASPRPRCARKCSRVPGRRKRRFAQMPGRAGLARGAHDLTQLLGPVGDPGQDRRHPDARLHAGVDERLHRPQPLARVRGRRLGSLPDLLVERRDRERHATRPPASHASTSTSRSRTIIGPRVMIPNGFDASRSTSRHARVSLYLPSAGWYGIGRGADRHLLPLPRSRARAPCARRRRRSS